MSDQIPPVPFYCQQVKKEIRVAGIKASPRSLEIEELTCNGAYSCGVQIGVSPCKAKEMLLKNSHGLCPKTEKA